MKNPGVAAVLSFFIPGLGHIYIGEIKKGLLLLLAYGLSVILTLIVVGYVTGLAVWLYAMINAYKTAEQFNKNYPTGAPSGGA